MKKKNHDKKTIKLVIQQSEETIEFGDFIDEAINFQEKLNPQNNSYGPKQGETT